MHTVISIEQKERSLPERDKHLGEVTDVAILL
jgi:hypothetical protein